MRTIRKSALVLATSMSLLGAASVQAAEVEETPSAGAMIGDLLIVRPVMAAITQIGTIAYAASLPFSLMGGNTDEVAKTLVVGPAQTTYTRCLGCGGDESNEKTVSLKHFVLLDAAASYDPSEQGSKLGASYGGGFAFGTNFHLSDDNRFDVQLGYRAFLEPENFEKEAGQKPKSYEFGLYHVTQRAGTSIFDSNAYAMVKLGVNKWNYKMKAEDGSTSKDNGLGIHYGLGIDYVVSDAVRLGLGYTAYSFGDVASTLNTYDTNIAFMF